MAEGVMQKRTGRVRDYVRKMITFDTESVRMLDAISGGRYSACVRLLIAREYGRLEGLGRLPDQRAAREL